MKLITIRKIVLTALASWLSLVVFIDFIVAPTVFKTVSKRIEAGELGMKVFSALGVYETILGVALFIVGGIVFKLFRTRRSAALFLFGTSLFAFAILGKFYLTPEITRLNLEKYTLDEQSKEYEVVNKRHEFLHNFYVKLDTVKIFFLAAGLVGCFRASRFDQEKILWPIIRRKS